MAASLVGYWPGETAITLTQVSNGERRAVSSKQSITLQPTRGIDDAPARRPSSAGESNISQDVYYDALSSPLIMAQNSACVAGPSQTIGSEPEPTESNGVADTEWRKFQPPKELFDVPYGTPFDDIIVSSVERLQQQHAEEQSFHENQAFLRAQEQTWIGQDIPVIEIPPQLENSELLMSRTPRPYSSATVATESISSRERPRLSDASITTTSSGDSGYVSAVADTTVPKGRLSGLFRFTGSLRPSRDKLDTSKRTSFQSGSSTTTVECVSCLDDFNSKDVVPLTCHGYCKPCFQTLISTALSSESHWPPKCCLNEIPTETLLPHLTPAERKRYKEVFEERSVPAGERIYCSKASCAAWIPPNNIQKPSSCAVCVSCRQKTCTSCRGVYHSTGECPRDANLQATLQVAQDEGWRRCFSCNALVEHNQGCIHMTCRCKAQFCYICGSRWRTCSCSDMELQRILQAANSRRAVADARDRATENQRRADRAAAAAAEAEAAELRDILRQIERFEIEEADRLAREEEELRLAAIASRQLHEEERIFAISRRYFDLRNDLDFLHAVQKVAMAERHEEERQGLRQEERMRKSMPSRHEMDIQLAEAAATAQVSDSQFRFDQEYQTRLRREREIEDTYVAELKAYWKNRPGGEEKVVEGRDALRKAHEESYRRWEGGKRAAHEQILLTTKEELARLRRTHEVERALAAGRLASREEQLSAGRRADVKWVERVTEIRMQMLEEMEMEEYSLVG